MIRRIVQIFLVLTFIVSLISCGGFTPPMPHPGIDTSLGAGANLEELPLEEMPEQVGQDGDGDVDASISFPPISADSSEIYILDVTENIVKNENVSVVTVDTGTFSPGEIVDVFAYVQNAGEIDSGPSIIGFDLFSDIPYIQLVIDSEGGLEFQFVAQYSAGDFVLVVKNENLTLSVGIAILDPLDN